MFFRLVSKGARHRFAGVQAHRAAVAQHHVEVVVAAEGVAPRQPIHDHRRGARSRKGQICALACWLSTSCAGVDHRLRRPHRAGGGTGTWRWCRHSPGRRRHPPPPRVGAGEQLAEGTQPSAGPPAVPVTTTPSCSGAMAASAGAEAGVVLDEDHPRVMWLMLPLSLAKSFDTSGVGLGDRRHRHAHNASPPASGWRARRCCRTAPPPAARPTGAGRAARVATARTRARASA